MAKTAKKDSGGSVARRKRADKDEGPTTTTPAPATDGDDDTKVKVKNADADADADAGAGEESNAAAADNKTSDGSKKECSDKKASDCGDKKVIVDVDPVLLDTPVKNIRVKVNVSSKEIVGVKGDPVEEGEETDDGDDKKNNKADENVKEGDDKIDSDGLVKEEAVSNKKEEISDPNDAVAVALPETEVIEEEIGDVMNIGLPGTEAESSGGSATKREGVVLDYFGASIKEGSGDKESPNNATTTNSTNKGKDGSTSASDEEKGSKANNGGKKSKDGEAIVTAAKATLYRDYESDMDGDDEEDPGAADDSSYAESNKGRNETDDDDDDDDESMPPEAEIVEEEDTVESDNDDRAGPVYKVAGGSATLQTKVRITNGSFKGKVGTIIDVNRGWFTLNSESGVAGSVRARDFEVLTHDDSNRPAADNKEDEDDDESDDEEEEIDLVGASIRVKSGKFEGLLGKVNERRSYRHVQLNARPPIPPIHISSVGIIKHPPGEPKTKKGKGNKSTRSNEDLARMYMGAEVRVTRPDNNAGIEGTVLKVIIGDWYITDNPKITNAYQAHKFEILELADGSKPKKKKNKDEKVDNDVAENAAAKKGSDEKEIVKEEMKQQKEKAPDKVVSDITHAPRSKKSEGSKKGKKESKVKEEAKQDEDSKPMPDDAHSGAIAEAAAATATSSASSLNEAASSRNRPSTGINDDSERNLIGATVRIKKGRFKNLQGVIKEKHSMRRLQLDSIPDPLGFDDIQVLEYAGGNAFDNESNDDFAKKYQQYVGARVKVIGGNEDFVGMEGMVIRVIVMGDWYITDNPNIPMAFPEHKFEVVSYPDGADGQEEEIVGSDEAPDANVGEEGEYSRKGKGAKSEEKKREKDKTRSSKNKKAGDDHVTLEETDDEGKEVVDDWGDNGGEFVPESPVASGNQPMDVDKEEDSAKKSASDVKKTSQDADNTVTFAEKEKANNAIDNPEEDDKDKVQHVNENRDTSIIGSEDEDAMDENRIDKQRIAEDNTKGVDNVDNEPAGVGGGHSVEADSKQKAPPPLSPIDPLPGASVHVFQGVYKGLNGKIIATEQRGWWTIDNPDIAKKVKSSSCQIIDDGGADIDAIWQWYNHKDRRRSRMPAIVKPNKNQQEEGEEEFEVVTPAAASCFKEELTPDNMSTPGKMNIDNDEGGFKRKVFETDFTGEESRKRRKELGVVIANEQEGSTTNSGGLHWGTNSVAAEGSGRKRPRHQPPKMRDCMIPALNPILLQPSCGIKQKKDQLKMQLLPANLRHLPSDAKIEIFNRRTGRIMKGDDAIALSELPRALMDHAEYEPIVPPPPGNTRITSRVGRSSPRVRINRDIIPQTRIRASRVEGRSVLVTGGEYRGLSGTIDSTIPGGWYLVSNLFKNDSLEVNVVINSHNLELIPENITLTKTQSMEGQGVPKIRMHLKAAKLRLASFAEERSRLEKCGLYESKARELKKLDAEVSKTNKLTADLQKALDRKLNCQAKLVA